MPARTPVRLTGVKPPRVAGGAGTPANAWLREGIARSGSTRVMRRRGAGPHRRALLRRQGAASSIVRMCCRRSICALRPARAAILPRLRRLELQRDGEAAWHVAGARLPPACWRLPLVTLEAPVWPPTLMRCGITPNLAESEARFRAALKTRRATHRAGARDQIARIFSTRRDFARGEHGARRRRPHLGNTGPRRAIRYPLERGRTLNSSGQFDRRSRCSRMPSDGATRERIAVASCPASASKNLDEAMSWTRVYMRARSDHQLPLGDHLARVAGQQHGTHRARAWQSRTPLRNTSDAVMGVHQSLRHAAAVRIRVVAGG